MDEDMLKYIVEAVKQLQKDQRAHSYKLVKVTDVCRNKFKEVKFEFNEKNKEVEDEFKKVYNTLDNLEINVDERVANLKEEETKLSENVSILEVEREVIAVKIHSIDKALIELNENIIELKNKPENEDTTETKELDKKQCKFYKQGYCREKESCPFYHSDQNCSVYLSNGICWKRGCRERHPKPCRYNINCFRGKSCRYFHDNVPCDRCDTFSHNLYYCEICKKSYCQNCTVKEAHTRNIYENVDQSEVKCEHLHQG